MSVVVFWVLLSLVLVTICPDPWQARREIAKRHAEMRREAEKARSRAQSE